MGMKIIKTIFARHRFTSRKLRRLFYEYQLSPMQHAFYKSYPDHILLRYYCERCLSYYDTAELDLECWKTLIYTAPLQLVFEGLYGTMKTDECFACTIFGTLLPTVI